MKLKLWRAVVVGNLAISVYAGIRAGTLLAHGATVHYSPVVDITLVVFVSILIGIMAFILLYLVEGGVALVLSQGKEAIKAIWNPDW